MDTFHMTDEEVLDWLPEEYKEMWLGMHSKTTGMIELPREEVIQLLQCFAAVQRALQITFESLLKESAKSEDMCKLLSNIEEKSS